MIRKIKKEDKLQFIAMSEMMYASDAVSHNVPTEHHIRTFDELMRSDIYADAYIFECGGKTAGFALLAKTFSREAGGMVIWIEEIYIKEEFRGKGLGTEFFEYIENNKPKNTARLRLEVEEDNTGAVALYKRMGYDFLEYRQMIKDFSLS